MKRNQFVTPKNPGLTRCTNARVVLKRHSQASLQMLSQNISPLGAPSATLCLRESRDERPASIAKEGPFAKRGGDVF